MSVEIAFDTTDAQAKVDALGEALLGLAEKAEQGSKGASQKLSFGSDALKELKALRAEMDALRASVKGFGDSAGEQAKAQASLRQQAANSAATTIAQVQALKTLQKTQSDATASMVADKERIKRADKESADAASAYAKQQADAYNTTTYTHKVSVAQREENLRAWQAALNADAQRTKAALKVEQDAYAEDAARTRAIKQQNAKAEATIEANKFRLETELRNEYMRAEAAAYAEEGQRVAAAVKRRADAEIAALKTVQNELKSTISAQQTYAQKVAALGTLRAMNAQNPNSGINPAQYASALGAARNELLATEMAAARAAMGLGKVSGAMGIGTQAAAGLRAGMQGAGMGFGGFAASTVATAAGVFAVTSALKDAVETGSQFQFAFQRAAAILGEFTKTANGNQLSASGKALEEEILRISTTSQYTASQVADAVKELAQAGMTTGQVMANLRPILNTATVGMISVADAAKITANVIAQFGLSADSAGHVGDVLAKAANISTIEIADLAKSLQYAGTISHLAGESLETTAAAIALLGQAGIKGSKGGTALRDVVLDLAAAEDKSTKAGKAFAKLGIEITKNAQGGVDLEKTFNSLFSALNKLPESQKLGTLIQIFGKIGSSGAAALMKFSGSVTQTGTVFSDFLHKVTDESNGYSSSLANLFNDNVQTAFKNLLAMFDVVSIKAFGIFGGPLQAKIKEFTAYISENQDEIAQNLSSIMTSLISLAEFIVKYAPQILSVVKAFLEFKIIRGIFTLAAEGIALFSAATKIMKVEALAAASATEVLGVATVGASGAMAASGVATGIAATGFRALLPLIGGIPGLMAAAGVAGYLLGQKIIEMGEEAQQPAIDFQNLISSMHDLKKSSEDIGKMSGDDAIAYFKKVSDGAKSMQAELAKANEAVAAAKAGKDSAASLAYSLPNDQDAQNNATAATIAWNEARGRSLVLSKELKQALAEESAAFVNIISQTAESAAFFDTLTKAMTDVFAIGSLITKMGSGGKMLGGMFEGVSGYANGFLNFTQTLNANVKASREAKDAAANHAKAEADRAAAASESKSRIRELASELKSIIKDYGSTTGAIADMNRQLSQVDAIEKSLSGGKAAQVLNDIGASAELAGEALDWKRSDIVIDTVSAALGRLDPRFKDLAKTMTDTGKGTQSFSALLELATDIVEKSTLSDQRKTEILGKLRQAMKDVEEGTAALQTKMQSFVTSTTAAWEQFNTTDTMEGRINSWGKAFSGASAEQQKNAQISAAQASLIKGLGSDYAASLNPMQAYKDNMAALNYLESQGIEIVGGYAKARQKLYEATPLGQMQKQNADLQTQIDLTRQGGDAWEIYSTALQAVNGDISLLTPGLLASAEATVHLREELAQVQEVQAAFKTLADGIAHTFADVFTGGVKNFKDFKSKIKDIFKQLLNDLIAMWFKNQLMSIFGMGGGGNSGSFWSSIVSSFTGGGGGGGSFGGNSSGGGGSNIVGSLINSVLGTSGNNNSSWNMSQMFSNAYTGNTGSAALGNGGGGGMGPIGNIGWTWAGKAAASPFGSATAAAAPWLGAVAGGVYGAGRGDGGMGTVGSTTAGVIAGYYAGTVAASAIGYAAAAYGATAAAGTATAGAATAGGAAAGASAGLAAIPIVGWIALLALIVDKYSGGKVFGTKFKTESIDQKIGTNSEGGIASLDETQFKYRSQFSQAMGRFWTGGAVLPSDWGDKDHRNISHPVPPEMQAVADKLFAGLQKTYQNAANKLGIEALPVLDSAFDTVTKYSDKGKVKSTTTTSTVKGKEYKEDFEAYQKRINAEAIIDSIDAALPKIYAKNLTLAPTNSSTSGDGTNNGPLGQNAPGVITKAMAEAEALSTEANKIAERWRADAATLLDGAQFLLQAATDMNHSDALLGKGSTLTQVTDLIESMRVGEESLLDTYTRVKAAFDLVDASLGSMGASLNKTRTEYVQWSSDLVDSLGGLAAASQAFQDFMALLGSLGTVNTGKIALDSLQKKLSMQLEGLGLDATTTAQQFADAFQTMLPHMTADEAASWIKVAASFNALKQMKDALSDFMFGIEGELAGFEGRNYTHQLDDINRKMNANIAQAMALGASEEQLARIRKLAAYQTSQVIAQLTADIQSLSKQLYGIGGDDSASASAHQQQMNDIAEVSDAQREMYDAAKQAIQDITDFLKALKVGDLAPTGTKGKLDAASAQFEQTLQAALGGDPEAMGNLTQDAQTFLELAQQYFGTGVDYSQIYDHVTTALEDAQHAFEQIPNPGNGNSGGDSSGSASVETHLTTQERYQLALQLAQDIGQLGLASSKDITTLLKGFGLNIDSLAHDLGIDINKWDEDTGPNIAIMAQALGMKVPDLITMLGGKMDEIAEYYGVKSDDIIAGNVEALNAMAESLGINVIEAMNLLGLPITDLLTGMGLDLTTLTKDTPGQLASVAEKLGLSVLDLMGAAGVSMTDLVTAWNNGVPITKLDETTMGALSSIASTLGINIVQLLTSMGISAHDTAEQLSTLAQSQIDALPDLPENIKDKLTDLFAALASADTADDIAASSGDIATFVSTLPDDIQALLRPLLEPLGLFQGPAAATLTDVDSSITDVSNDTDVIATNTGEDGPIVRELKRINGSTAATSSAASASSAAFTMDFSGGLDAAQAFSNAFFDAGINPSDFGDDQNVSDYTDFNKDASNNTAVQESASSTHAQKTAAATEKTAKSIEQLQLQIAALHKELASQTKTLSSIGSQHITATEKTTKAIKNKDR